LTGRPRRGVAGCRWPPGCPGPPATTARNRRSAAVARCNRRVRHAGHFGHSGQWMAAVQHGKGRSSRRLGPASSATDLRTALSTEPGSGSRPLATVRLADANRRSTSRTCLGLPSRYSLIRLRWPSDRPLDVFGQRAHVLADRPVSRMSTACGRSVPVAAAGPRPRGSVRPAPDPWRATRTPAAPGRCAGGAARSSARQRRLVQPLRVVHDDDQRPHRCAASTARKQVAAHVDGRHVRRHPVGPGVCWSPTGATYR